MLCIVVVQHVESWWVTTGGCVPSKDTVVQIEVAKIEKDHSLVLEEKESTIHDMEKKVKTSQQFLEQKDTMDSALQQLEQTLELERKQHKEQIG